MEDTAAANRPSEVEKDFAAFFDNERMDAIEKCKPFMDLRKTMTLVSLTGPRLACMIFEVRKMKKIFILFSFF